MRQKRHADQTGTGVFFIALAILFVTGFWWPGILFAVAASQIARAVAAGREWTDARGALWLIGIGAIFWLPGALSLHIGSLAAVLLILLGLFMLLGGNHRPAISRHEYDVDADIMMAAAEKPKRKNGTI